MRRREQGRFIHKLQIVLKELRETVYWLRLSQRSGLIGADEPLLEQARSLTNIIAKSIITAKQNKQRNE
ncbi:four helix bundle protein [bacterium]|nr:four helix bundle protein [bacterium]